MRLEIELVEMEHIVNGNFDPSFLGSESKYSAVSGTLTYKSLGGPQYLDDDLSLVIGEGDYNDLVRKIWTSLVAAKHHIPCGELCLRNYLLVGDSALCVQPTEGVALVGSPLNWGIDYTRWYVSELAKRDTRLTAIVGKKFELETESNIPTVEEPFLLFAAPGCDVYGHWIIDYVPRFFLLQFMQSGRGTQLLFSKLPSWSDIFLDAFEITHARISYFDSRKFSTYCELRVASSTKNGFSMAQPINKLAWSYFSTYVRLRNQNEKDVTFPKFSERVFLSRRVVGSKRPIENIRRLEEIAVGRGYSIVEPESFDVRTQAEILRNAKIVIGEDGSALHNIIFTDPGAHLGVIASPERPNLWHVSICQAFGHRISYIAVEINANGKRDVREELFIRFLMQLEN